MPMDFQEFNAEMDILGLPKILISTERIRNEESAKLAKSKNENGITLKTEV